MDEGVFRWIWRFNALAIAGCAALGLLLGASALFYLIRDLTAERAVAGVVNVTPEAETTTTREVGVFSPLGRTGLLWAPIQRASTTALRVSSKYATAVEDYLIYDPATGADRRLLSKPDAMIVETRLLYPPEAAPNEQPPALALLVVYIDADSSGDGRLTDTDARQIALARPDGTGLAPLAVAGRTLGVSVVSDREAVAMIATPEGVEALHLDLVAREVTRRAAIGR